MQPFTDILWKWFRFIAEHGGEDWLKNRRVLDVGSDIGYNSIFLTRDFDCNITALEIDPRNLEKAKMIAELRGVDVNLQQGNTGTYCSADRYACRYIHGFGNDLTNYWALSPKVVAEILERY